MAEHQCEICRGTGEVGGGVDGDMTCWRCEGTGIEPAAPPSKPPKPANDE